MSTAAAAANPPPRLDGFELRGELGAGGMGVVYLARQLNPPRDVALKVLLQWPDDPRGAERFQHEIQILAGLKHEGVAAIYHCGIAQSGAATNALPWFAMELVDEGTPITRWADEQRLDTDRRLELFVRVCDALAYVHQKSVVHRDLKPSNILVGKDKKPKLIDFGIARSLVRRASAEASEDAGPSGVPRPDGDASRAAPRAQAPAPDSGTAAFTRVLGTLAYASPEQRRGQHADTLSDVYALGIVLSELVFGRRIVSERELDLEQRGSREELEQSRPAAAIGACARDVAAIALRACDPARGKRYPTVQALRDDVQRVLERRPLELRGLAPLYRARRFAQRRRYTTLALVLLGLALGVTFAWLVVALRTLESRSAVALEQAVRITDDILPRIDGRQDSAAVREKLLDDAVGLVEALVPDSVDTPRGLEALTKLDVLRGQLALVRQGAGPALAHLHAAERHAQARRALVPREFDAGLDLGITLQRLADAELAAGDTDAAERTLSRAFDVAEQLAGTAAQTAHARRLAANLRLALAELRLEHRDARSALVLLDAAERALVELLTSDPRSDELRADHGAALSSRAHAHEQLGELELAAADVAAAESEFAALVARHPFDAQPRIGLAIARWLRGKVEERLDRQADALGSYESAAQQLDALQRDDPRDLDVAGKLIMTRSGFAQLARQRGEVDAAAQRQAANETLWRELSASHVGDRRLLSIGVHIQDELAKVAAEQEQRADAADAPHCRRLHEQHLVLALERAERLMRVLPSGRGDLHVTRAGLLRRLGSVHAADMRASVAAAATEAAADAATKAESCYDAGISECARAFAAHEWDDDAELELALLERASAVLLLQDPRARVVDDDRSAMQRVRACLEIAYAAWESDAALQRDPRAGRAELRAVIHDYLFAHEHMPRDAAVVSCYVERARELLVAWQPAPDDASEWTERIAHCHEFGELAEHLDLRTDARRCYELALDALRHPPPELPPSIDAELDLLFVHVSLANVCLALDDIAAAAEHAQLAHRLLDAVRTSGGDRARNVEQATPLLTAIDAELQRRAASTSTR